MSVDTVDRGVPPAFSPEAVEGKGDGGEAKRNSKEMTVDTVAKLHIREPAARGLADSADSTCELDDATFAFLHVNEVAVDDELLDSYFPKGFGQALMSAKRVASGVFKGPASARDKVVDFHLERLKEAIEMQVDVDWEAHGYSKHYEKVDKGAAKFKAEKRSLVLRGLVAKGYEYKVADGKVRMSSRVGPEAEAARILAGSVGSAQELEGIARSQLEQEGLIREGYSYEVRGDRIVLIEKRTAAAAAAREALEGVVSDTDIVDVFRKEAQVPLLVEEAYQVKIDSKGNVTLLERRTPDGKIARKALKARGISKSEIAPLAKGSHEKRELIFEAYGYKSGNGQFKVVARGGYKADQARTALEARGVSQHEIEMALRGKSELTRKVLKGYDYELKPDGDLKRIYHKQGPEAKQARDALHQERISKSQIEEPFQAKSRVVRMIKEAFTYTVSPGGVAIKPNSGDDAQAAQDKLMNVYGPETITKMCTSLAKRGKI